MNSTIILLFLCSTSQIISTPNTIIEKQPKQSQSGDFLCCSTKVCGVNCTVTCDESYSCIGCTTCCGSVYLFACCPCEQNNSLKSDPRTACCAAVTCPCTFPFACLLTIGQKCSKYICPQTENYSLNKT